METTEKIVEAYVRYVKGWATIPNIKCEGQYEIDLLAVDPKTVARAHIESGVSISGGFSCLTTKPYSDADLKVRVKQAGQRRTLGYFFKRKFAAPGVLQTLQTYGFTPGNYSKVIVTWDATDSAKVEATANGVQLWFFPQMITEIAWAFKDKKTYFTDDTLRTLHLFAKVLEKTGILGIHEVMKQSLDTNWTPRSRKKTSKPLTQVHADDRAPYT
jgi:hypothetical protein